MIIIIITMIIISSSRTVVFTEVTRDPYILPIPASEQIVLLREPLPCDPAAETFLQPLIRCSESLSSQKYYAPEEFLSTEVSQYPLINFHGKMWVKYHSVWQDVANVCALKTNIVKCKGFVALP